MKPEISVLTIGVDDHNLQSGLRLALWPRRSISHDSGLGVAAPSSADFSIGHNVASPRTAESARVLQRFPWV